MLCKNQDTISLTSSQLKRRTYIKKITTSPSHQASKTVMKSPTWEITRRRPNESHVSSALIFSIKSLSKFVIAGQWENGSFGILPHGVQKIPKKVQYIWECYWVSHITYKYIDPSRHNVENSLPPWFVSQSCLGWPLAARPAKGALIDKSWKDTIFKISDQRFNK